MKLKHPYIQKTLGFVSAAAARVARRTIDWRAVYTDPTLDTVHPRFIGRCVFVCWHECLVMPIILRGEPRMLALASEHGDGEIISVAMQRLGWSMARGSSSRGGTAALLRMLREGDSLPNLTPDGPRGPRRHFSLGAVFLACKLELPLVCVGYGYDRPWRMRSWDSFAVPRPFSRCRAVFGPAVTVPANADRTMLERYRVWFEKELSWLTDEAEAWAASGESREGQLSMLPGKASAAMLRDDTLPQQLLPAPLMDEWAALRAETAAGGDDGAGHRPT